MLLGPEADPCKFLKLANATEENDFYLKAEVGKESLFLLWNSKEP
jgi:hypothetical protein